MGKLRSARLRIPLAAAFWLLVTGCAPAMHAPVPTPTTAAAPSPTTSYHSPQLKLSIRYPANWQVQSPFLGHFAGDDGFLQIGTIKGDRNAKGVNHDSLDAIIADQKQTKLYGSNPTTEELTVGGQPARLLLPGPDAPEDRPAMALIVVRYPRPVIFRSSNGHVDRYDWVGIWADWLHIRQIAQTVAFDDSPVTTPVRTSSTS